MDIYYIYLYIASSSTIISILPDVLVLWLHGNIISSQIKDVNYSELIDWDSPGEPHHLLEEVDKGVENFTPSQK